MSPELAVRTGPILLRTARGRPFLRPPVPAPGDVYGMTLFKGNSMMPSAPARFNC
jgi:hypothetical protein